MQQVTNFQHEDSQRDHQVIQFSQSKNQFAGPPPRQYHYETPQVVEEEQAALASSFNPYLKGKTVSESVQQTQGTSSIAMRMRKQREQVDQNLNTDTVSEVSQRQIPPQYPTPQERSQNNTDHQFWKEAQMTKYSEHSQSSQFERQAVTEPS